MRKLITLLFILCTMTVSAQDYVREGTVFTQTTVKNAGKLTGFTFKDRKGVSNPIYITETGRCYILKVSQKTGKEYKYYLSEQLSKEICAALGKEYTYKKK